MNATTACVRPNPRLRALPAALALLAALVFGHPAAAHPQDGPHADVRIRLDERVLRWNIGLNLAYMDEIVDVGRERIDAVAAIEADILRDAVLEHLAEDNRVLIDGRLVRPEVRLWALREGDPTLLPMFPRAGMRGLIRAEIILDYPHDGAPESLELTWADYPMDVLSAELEGGSPAPLVLQAQLQAEGVIELIEFSAGMPTVTWHATGRTIDERLRPVPDLAEAIAAAGFGDAEGSFPSPPPTAGTDARAPAASPEAVGDRGADLGVFLLAGTAILVLGVVVMPGRPRSARLLGVSLATGLLTAAGWWMLAGPASRTGEFATDPPRVAASRAAPATTATGPIPAAACVAVFEPLLLNVYTAFDYSEESDVYDALARSVDGALLEELYRRIHRGLVMDDHDRAVARVSGVELIDATVAAPDEAAEGRFEVAARWRVDGTVVHWGHAHVRIHEYAARSVVRRTDRGWRITDQVILEQSRIPNPADPIDQGVEVGLPPEMEFEL
ncbi:MAG: hypothetical protein ACYTEV_04645 [Planctomycetota bacterium]